MRPSRHRLASVLVRALLPLLTVAGCGSGPDEAGARTVVLVTVDTLRFDHVGALAPRERPSPAATPRMDALAAGGLRFLDARTPAVLTLPAHVTMLTGLPPAAHGIRSNSASRVPPPPARPWRLVPETLRATGRACGAFVSAGPLARRYGLDAAFDVYDDGDLGGRTSLAYARRAGSTTVALALAWLRSLPPERRVFLWVHLFEPHDPYPAGYARAVEEADACVGLLLDGLAAAGRGDAAIVLASDHGEALGELGERTHGFLLAESVLRVPLLVRGPGLPPGVREDPVDLADVAPFLHRWAGVPPPALPAVPGVGRDVLTVPAPPDRPRVAEALHAWHQHRWAQLTCAVIGTAKLEDRGEGRERVLRLDRSSPPYQDAGTPAGRQEALPALASALRSYRRLEDRSPAPGGVAPGGYGRGGSVGFFLEPSDNARRPDPYAVIEDAYRVNHAASVVLADPPLVPRLEASLADLRAIRRRDPGNPSVAFWEGRALRVLGRHGEALEAFERALALGGCDTETLLLLLRSAAAADRPEAGRAAAATCLGGLPPDPRLEEARAALR